MYKPTLKRWVLLGTFTIACGSVVPVVSQTTESEMLSIATQLGLFIPKKVVDNQASQLSAEFRKEFRTKSQLNTKNVHRYISNHPLEVMAFRSYVQQLTDSGVISGDLAESLVVSAFQTLHTITNDQIVASASTLNTTIQKGSTKSAIEPLSSQIEPVSTSSESSLRIDSKTIDFGESLERDQRASMAAQELEDKIEEQKRTERNKLLARALIEEFSQGRPTPESLGRRVERVMSDFAETETKKQADAVLDNVEISVTSISNGPEYEVRGLKAFDGVNPNHFSFIEFGMTANDDDTTANIGIGIRKLSEDQTLMAGINAFYDQEFDTNHKRGSIGVELVSAPLRLNANRYFALSDGYQLNSSLTEKPLSGADVDIEAALPYFPGLFAGYNQSKWYGEDGASDIQRNSYRLKGNLSNNLSLEFGKRTYSSSIESQNTAKLSYNHIFGADSAPLSLLDFDTQPYRPRKIRPQERFRMVERENKIVTQVSSAGLQVTFTAL